MFPELTCDAGLVPKSAGIRLGFGRNDEDLEQGEFQHFSHELVATGRNRVPGIAYGIDFEEQLPGERVAPCLIDVVSQRQRRVDLCRTLRRGVQHRILALPLDGGAVIEHLAEPAQHAVLDRPRAAAIPVIPIRRRISPK